MLLSFLSQIQSVPKDYSITYARRWMAIHMATNVDYLRVIIFTFNYMYFPGKVKHTNFKLVYNNNGKVPHFLLGKSYSLHNQVFP